MANASRPKKSSLPRTSSSTGLPARAAAVDPLELFVTLVAGEENLSVNEARALLRLRRAQLAARDGAKGALVRVALQGNQRFDLKSSASSSVLLEDFFSLVLLQLIEDFPSRERELRALLHAKRKGMDIIPVSQAVWSTDSALAERWVTTARRFGVDAGLLGGVVAVAMHPLFEAIGSSISRHTRKAILSGQDCPICGAPPYCWHGNNYRCCICESAWPQAELRCATGGAHCHWVASGKTRANGFEKVTCDQCLKEMSRYEARLSGVFHAKPLVCFIRTLS